MRWMVIPWLIFSLVMILPAHAWAQDSAENPAGSIAAQTAPQTQAQTKPWVICNETSFILRLAIAKTVAGTSRASGWKKLRPSECLEDDLNSAESRFLFAESAPVHNGGIREWAGQVPICINPDENFSIDTSVSCALQGLETRRFLHIDPNESETKLIEPDDFKTKAETAGIQRLLRDAGYKITRIDGIDGRRTRNTLRDFLKDYEIAADLSVFEKMDALEDAALSKQDLTGLTLCNKTQAKIWTAIGYREDGAWQSRGWWAIDADACIRPWSNDLIGSEMHIYAYMKLDDDDTIGLINPLEAANNFCIAEAKFSAIGREFCTDKGYVAADFRAVPTLEKGLQITLSNADFQTSTVGGLRE